MNAHASHRTSPDALRDIRRQVAHELYGKLAVVSAAIWTLGTLVLFIIFAAPAAKPIPMAMMSMTAPLLPAALPWLLYRPLIAYLAARRSRAAVG